MQGDNSIPKTRERVRFSDMLNINRENYFVFDIIGEFCSADNWIHPVRTTDNYELIFVTDGEVFIEENGTRYELYRNQCILLEPGIVHGGWKTSRVPTSFYWLHFRTDMPMPFKTYTGDGYYDIKYLLKKLLHISKTPSYSKSAADAAAFMVFCELENVTAAVSGSSIANKIAEYIRINIDRGVTVADVAEYYSYSSDYISRLFRKTFGMGMKKYIMSEKIKFAKDLLLNTNLSVKEIAAQMGYTDENRFIKFFMYHEEISPTRLRDKYFNTMMNNR